MISENMISEDFLKPFIGIKRVLAKPMIRHTYYEYTEQNIEGIKFFNNNCLEDAGYLVEYLDEESNHQLHIGKICWMHKEVFERDYRNNEFLDFSSALFLLKEGRKVCRSGWNGKNMYLQYVSPQESPQIMGIVYRINVSKDIKSLPWIGMKTADDNFVPWLASQTDMLAEDWMSI